MSHERSPITEAHDQAVAEFRRRVVGLNALRDGAALASGWLFLWGVVVLVLRATTELPRPAMLWGAAGLAVVGVVAVARAWRRRPSETAVRALCDDTSHAGGLLMVGGEGSELGAWTQKLPRPALPELRWRGGRTLGVAAAAVAFIVVAFLAPARWAPQAVSHGLDISADAERLTEQIRVLEEEAILEEQEAAEAQERLDQLRQEALGQEPAKTWEALDHLDDRVEQAANEAAQQALQETESLTQSQTLAEALANEGDRLNDEQRAEAMAALAEMMQQAAAENAALDGSLGEALQQALQSGALSKEQLSQLASALQGRKMQIDATLSRLVDAKLLQMKVLSACRGLGQCNSEGLCEFLAFNMSQGGVKNALKSWGRGGLGRGRGDADMVWKQQASSEDGAAFEEVVLPPADLAAMRDSELVGLGAAAPTRDLEAGPAGSGALAGAEAGGGSATRQVVLPRHRAAVQRYFDRDGAPETP